MRIYAIGDVHGELELMEKLIAEIHDDLYEAHEPAELVFLGDYVDRGPDSMGVIDYVDAWVKNPAPFEKVTALRGNHEDLMMGALRGERDYQETWLYNGGIQTLKSYSKDMDRNAIPKKHIDFLYSTKLYYQAGDYVFVHANIDHSKPMEAQEERTLLWDRSHNHFDEPNPNGYFVVHGHTPVQMPHVSESQVNIDTGAVFGGDLTCVIIDTTKKFHEFHGFISVNADDR